MTESGGETHGSLRARYKYLRSDGTAYIIAGSAVAGLFGYAYQVLGGRVLGPVGFAPVSALLTIHFFTFIVVMIPIEQVVVRRLTLGRNALPWSAVWLGAFTVVGATAFAGLGVNEYLNGDARFIWFTALAVAAHFVFSVGRGFLAGRRRFRAYGISSGAASIIRLGIAVPLAIIGPFASGFALALIAGALVVLLWRPFSPDLGRGPLLTAEQADNLSDRGLLVGLVLAAASSQALLLAAPIVVGVIGGTGTQVSIAFAAFTLARAPLVFGYNLLARVLPPFTEMAATDRAKELAAWARGLAMTSVGLAIIAFALGWFVGPQTVAWAFGEGFDLSQLAAAVIAAGVVLSGSGLFVGQILVARGDAARLAVAWALGLGGATVVLVLFLGGDPITLVAVSFLVGEVVALLALVRGAVASRDGRSRVWLHSYSFGKRTMDLGVSLFVLIVSSPLLAIVAVATRIDSPGPVFFSQTRVGKGGKLFEILKVRTMEADRDEAVFAEHLARLEASRHEETAPVLKIEDDDRVTRIGAVLRKWSIDEIPNLWNVVRGDMSLVGPRPLVVPEAELVGLESSRFEVVPGITGLAQVRGRDELSIDERARHDEEYVETRNMRVDLRILFDTFKAIVVYRDRGAIRPKDPIEPT